MGKALKNFIDGFGSLLDIFPSEDYSDYTSSDVFFSDRAWHEVYAAMSKALEEFECERSREETDSAHQPGAN